jgi:hypothetical protein
MTPKRVEYDPHFVDDARDRGFTRQDARWLLERGMDVPTVGRAGDTRFTREGEIRGRQARLVYLENAERIYIISIQWVLSQGGRRRQKEGRGRRKGKTE